MCFDSGGSSNAPEQPPEIRDFYRFMKEVGADQFAYYKQAYRPLEDQLIDRTKRFLTPEYAAEQAGMAKQQVTQSFAGERLAREQRAMAMGLNPADARYQDRGLDLGEAGALAAAGTQARRGAEMTGYNALAGLAGRGDAKVGQAIGATQAGGQIANQSYGNTLDAWNTQQKQASQGMAGIGQLAGTAAGLFMLSDKNAKTGRKRYKGGLDALDKMKVDRWRYKPQTGMGGGEHVGAMAQDFRRATGLGDGKTIHPVDAHGVTMSAVKELHDKVRQMQAGMKKMRPHVSDPASEDEGGLA